MGTSSTSEIENDTTIAALIEGLRLDSPEEAHALFTRGRSAVEAAGVLEAIAAWLKQVNTQNHDGVLLTSALVRFLSDGDDVNERIAELDRLRSETREGRFDASKELQRELEYRRFWTEALGHPEWPKEQSEQRTLFDSLEVLPPQEKDRVCTLTDEDAHEARRSALEAKGLLDFLREFRSKTNRPITVFGNDRYGRIFLVEPLEPYLPPAQFDLLYDRVPSHASMRLTVPNYVDRFHRSGFAPTTIKDLNTRMPHIVAVDVCSPRATESYTKMPRGLRDLVNWFMVFNYIRAGGDRSRYEKESGLPSSNLAELEKWWQFEVVRRRLVQWIDPGSTYSISHWAPELMEEVIMGDLVVPAKPLTSWDEPQVVVANPGLYRTEGDDLTELLLTTHPYHFNDPEKTVAETIVPGFGNHGFETRVDGFTTDEYVQAIQESIGVELRQLAGNP
jgi:hypothetical protein